jgi:hypothetical protein
MPPYTVQPTPCTLHLTLFKPERCLGLQATTACGRRETDTHKEREREGETEGET